MFEGSVDERVKILANGAKYDVSCSSSGADRKGAKGLLGSAAAGGICHSFAADGRCISLLKILLTNNCVYDCLYCANRRSNDVPRATLTPRELANLTIDLYRRNYIEGLFLSSAVEHSPDCTMERMYEAVRILRKEYGFGGYIHLKCIPHADPTLVKRAAELADRMSVNIELPNEQGLKLLAPAKTKPAILLPMRQLSDIYLDGKETKRRGAPLPAGQTTQLIVGATPDPDGQIVKLSEALYRSYGLKRVYYSAYMNLNTSSLLPVLPTPLIREHRLYQADWLLRFYGFSASEILPENANLDLSLDPKAAWALQHPELFPLEVNTAPYEMLLRTPGVGVRGAWKIREARRHGNLGYDDLKRLRIVLKRARHFITVGGKFYGHSGEITREVMTHLDAPDVVQPSLLEYNRNRELTYSLITGEF